MEWHGLKSVGTNKKIRKCAIILLFSWSVSHCQHDPPPSRHKNIKVLKAALEDIYQNSIQHSTTLSMILFAKAKTKQREQKCLFLPGWAWSNGYFVESHCSFTYPNVPFESAQEHDVTFGNLSLLTSSLRLNQCIMECLFPLVLDLNPEALSLEAVRHDPNSFVTQEQRPVSLQIHLGCHHQGASLHPIFWKGVQLYNSLIEEIL